MYTKGTVVPQRGKGETAITKTNWGPKYLRVHAKIENFERPQARAIETSGALFSKAPPSVAAAEAKLSEGTLVPSKGDSFGNQKLQSNVFK